jgi:glycosyltransferase involved in cell wall biosynthesis
VFLAIVPAYNEEDSIGSVVRGIFPHVDRVVVVDDGSGDKTGAEAEGAGAVVLRHDLNRGQGAAIETGQEYARRVGAKYVLHFDADGQFDPADISPALKFLQEKQADILFGSRFLDDRSQVPFFKKYIILPLARFVDKLTGAVTLRDSHNGFRILNRNALVSVKLTQDRMAHATEIPSLVKKNNLRYVEFPVKVIYSEFGQSAVGGLKVIGDLVLGKYLK